MPQQELPQVVDAAEVKKAAAMTPSEGVAGHPGSYLDRSGQTSRKRTIDRLDWVLYGILPPDRPTRIIRTHRLRTASNSFTCPGVLYGIYHDDRYQQSMYCTSFRCIVLRLDAEAFPWPLFHQALYLESRIDLAPIL